MAVFRQARGRRGPSGVGRVCIAGQLVIVPLVGVKQCEVDVRPWRRRLPRPACLGNVHTDCHPPPSVEPKQRHDPVEASAHIDRHVVFLPEPQSRRHTSGQHGCPERQQPSCPSRRPNLPPPPLPCTPMVARDADVCSSGRALAATSCLRTRRCAQNPVFTTGLRGHGPLALTGCLQVIEHVCLPCRHGAFGPKAKFPWFVSLLTRPAQAPTPWVWSRLSRSRARGQGRHAPG